MALQTPKFRGPFQLATLAAKVPEGDGWLFEMKYDGYRCQAAIAGDQVKLYSRSGLDWTDKFGIVAPPLRSLTKGTLLIDGEICAIDAHGRSNFSLLKTSLDGKKPIVFFAFDLLEQDGENVGLRPQLERKLRLEALLGDLPPEGPLQYSQHVVGNGDAVFKAMFDGGFEGVIAKGSAAPYGAGDRSIAWLKVKCIKRQEFVVIGWRPPDYGPDDDVRGLFLATYEKGRLVYRGSVGTGFTDKMRRDTLAVLRLIRGEPLDVVDMPRKEARVIHWVQPRLLAEVAFTEITPDGLLRHPSFKGLREDKDPVGVVLERPRG